MLKSLHIELFEATFSMKTVFCLILITAHFACFAQLKVDLKSGDKITFMKANAEAFETTINGDSVIIKQLLFDRHDGLAFELSALNKANLKENSINLFTN